LCSRMNFFVLGVVGVSVSANNSVYEIA
jgi:hypothetical protein